MKTIRIALAVLVAAPLLTAGCATQRFVTNTHWKDCRWNAVSQQCGDTLYVSYSEWGWMKGTSAQVLKCSRRDDNSLACSEQDALNQVLNAR